MTIEIKAEGTGAPQQSMGERLLTLRNQNGLTQEELAERLAVSRQSISKWELNKALPDVEKLVMLSEMYCVSLDYLIKGSEPEAASGEHTEEAVSASGRSGGEVMIKQTIIFVCMLLSALLCLCMVFFSCRLLSDYTITKTGKQQQLVQVERVFGQYTSAEVLGFAEDGSYYEKVVWLDIPGVREGDFVYCYTDGENGENISFDYYSSTLALPTTFAIIFLIFFIAFAVAWRGERSVRGNKK